eukprot:c39593_g1_i1.p1 GENE.c39593_g1_i1~~c39593_g1_i1.p1  ORF type:complete len:363 (-),score=63.98 c39593_g1_i1:182-1270(-)
MQRQSLPYSLLSLLLAVAVVALSAHGRYSCLSYDGKPVDWWSLTKLPLMTDSSNDLANSGYGFVFMSSEDNDLSVSYVSINDTKAPMAATLLQMYENYDTDSTAWMLFNDQWPNGDFTLEYAHQKGLFFFDVDGGFYLIHSVPHYPEYLRNGYYGFPPYEIFNGQSALCLSVDYNAFVSVGALLQRSGPWIYDSNIPDSFTGLDTLRDVIKGKFITTPGTTASWIETSGGASFFALYKNKEWDQDLYEDFVAPTIKSGMLVQSWLEGGTPLPSYCRPEFQWEVLNVQSLRIRDPHHGAWIEWSNAIDHSKWGASLDGETVCIGGINRMFSQRVRGGGTVCHRNKTMWRAWNKTISTVEPCNA